MNKKTLISVGAGLLVAIVIIFTFWAPGESSTTALPSAKVMERAKESVKLVLKCRKVSESGIGPDNVLWTGSAFVINDQGCLITNAHVAGSQDENNNTIQPSKLEILYVVYEKQLRNRKVVVLQKATVEHMDISRDLAWIRVTPDRTNLRPLALAEAAVAGQGVTALGFPGVYDAEHRRNDLITEALINQILKERKYMGDRIELEWTSALGDLLNVVTVGGSVSEVRRGGSLHTGQGQDATCRIITHTAGIHSGMSGGPLINAQGQVVGVTFGAHMAEVVTDNGERLDKPIKTNVPLLNRAIDVAELRHFLTSQAPDGELLYVPGDPDSLLRRIRAHLNAAQPYEVALAAVGAVLSIGAVITLLFLLTSRRGGGQAVRPTGVPTGANPPVSTALDNEPTLPLGEAEVKTIPFPSAAAAGGSGAAELSVVLSGKDPDGNPLRFRFTESELKDKRTLLIGSRKRSCHVYLPFDYVSRQQARLIYEQDSAGNGLLFLSDENATNTTRINGTPVHSKCPLEPGDKITMGSVTLNLSIE